MQTGAYLNPYLCVMTDATPGQVFGHLIREGRRRKGWSQETLVERSGVSRSTISRWERDLADKPEPEQVRAVCLALDVDPRYAAVALGLLTWEEIGGKPEIEIDPTIEEVIRLLRSPTLAMSAKEAWIAYLRYLVRRSEQQTDDSSRP